MKYRILKCRNAGISDYVKNFNKRLEKFLNNGWELHGVLQVVIIHNEFVQYHQAIIKKEPIISEPKPKPACINIADLNMKSGIDINKNDFEYIKEQTINSC
tara:strand:+ start:777 stop:1079 length:303 start_codon:yes stop_codon:yes gene_type:complete